MTTATSVSQDQSLKPFPLGKDWCPLCRTTLSTISLIFAMTIFGVSIGACLGLAEIGLSVLTGILVGGVISVIMGLASSVLLDVEASDKHMKYRMATLKQMEENHVNPKVLVGVRKLKEILNRPIIRFKQVADNHALHNWTTQITKNFDRSREDIKKIWELFIKNMGGQKAYNPNGKEVLLDFSYEEMRLQGKACPLLQGFLDKSSATFEKDLEQIEQLQRESFGIEEFVFSKMLLKRELQADFRNQCAVIRKKEEGEIIGFAWYHYDRSKKGLVIPGLGRTPGAAHFQIGTNLMNMLIQKIARDSKDAEVYLQVRASNETAKRLYESFCFVKDKDLPGYYPYPRENGILMKIDWKALEERMKKGEKR